MTFTKDGRNASLRRDALVGIERDVEEVSRAKRLPGITREAVVSHARLAALSEGRTLEHVEAAACEMVLMLINRIEALESDVAALKAMINVDAETAGKMVGG
jgi:hypothetical protein